MAQADSQLILSSSRGRDLQRHIEHMEYISGLQRAATEEGAKNHAHASTNAYDLAKWNGAILAMAAELGCLDEDFHDFIRANNSAGLQLIGRLTQEGDIKLIEQVARAPVESKKYLLDEAAHVLRQLKSGL
jgi:hypothetical protein